MSRGHTGNPPNGTHHTPAACPVPLRLCRDRWVRPLDPAAARLVARAPPRGRVCRTTGIAHQSLPESIIRQPSALSPRPVARGSQPAATGLRMPRGLGLTMTAHEPGLLDGPRPLTQFVPRVSLNSPGTVGRHEGVRPSLAPRIPRSNCSAKRGCRDRNRRRYRRDGAIGCLPERGPTPDPIASIGDHHELPPFDGGSGLVAGCSDARCALLPPRRADRPVRSRMERRRPRLDAPPPAM